MGKKLCWICWVLLTLLVIFVGYIFVQMRNPPSRVSPMDMVELPVEGGQLTLIYSRPSMRGRKIFGELVPYGEVWRTGANEATSFATDVDLELSGTLVPAGAYTLFTLPAEGGMTLILNRQTGQWGTVYDPSQDLARIGMHVAQLEEPVEMLTLDLKPLEAPAATEAAAPSGEGAMEEASEEGAEKGGTSEAPKPTAGWLRLRWETTEATVPFRVAGG